MILQRDKRLLPEIQKYGCYYMSILFLINKHRNYEWDTDKINEYYKTLVHLGHIQADNDFTTVDKDDGLILHPDDIFALSGLKVKYTRNHEPPQRKTQDNEIEILKFLSSYGAHFVVGDGAGHVAYDPWGNSRAVRQGRIESKRIFRLL